MFRNYLAAALRNLVRNKLYAAINIIGLAVGFTAALLIGLFVRDEFSYDKWIPEYEHIVMISMKAVFPHATDDLEEAPYFAAELLGQEFSTMEATARLGDDSMSVRHGDTEFQEKILWADPTIFDVIKLPAVAGNLATALARPEGVVITRSIARKYFGSDAVVGQTLEFNRNTGMRVTAVLDDLPSNTHLALGIIASGTSALSRLTYMDAHPPLPGDLPQIVYTYVRLKSAASIDDLQRALPAFARRHPEFQTRDAHLTLYATPISAIHLRPIRRLAMKDRGDIDTVYGLLLVGALIVGVASINFINLTTAIGARRAVEVGVRKLTGAERRHIVMQFICESICYVAAAMVLAIMLSEFVLPALNGYLQRTIAYRRDLFMFAGTVAIVVVVGGAAGAYPAFVLSRFTPARVLKGVFGGPGKSGVRRLLVTFQFAVLIGLALVVAIIGAQLRYAMNDGLRFNKDLVLEIDASCNSAFVPEVRRLSGVVDTTCAKGSILEPSFPVRAIAQDAQTISPVAESVGFGYFEFFGLKPVAGRFFSRDFGGDAASENRDLPKQPAVVINESLVHALGFASAADAVGQTFRWQRPISGFNMNLDDFRPSQIIGVVADFARGSVRETIPPTLFLIDPVAQRVLYVKLEGARIPETLAAIDQLWKRAGATRPISRTFLDQSIQALYLDLMRETQVLTALAVVAAFIAALGLFGLSVLTAESRTKEIGIRKAMGASQKDVLRLLVWEFCKPVLWANAFAWPAAFAFAHHWLEGYAYHIALSPWMFLAASVLALAIAAITVSGHAFLIARSQPATALRYE